MDTKIQSLFWIFCRNIIWEVLSDNAKTIELFAELRLLFIYLLDKNLTLWHSILGILMIYTLLLQNVIIEICALFCNFLWLNKMNLPTCSLLFFGRMAIPVQVHYIINSKRLWCKIQNVSLWEFTSEIQLLDENVILLTEI